MCCFNLVDVKSISETVDGDAGDQPDSHEEFQLRKRETGFGRWSQNYVINSISKENKVSYNCSIWYATSNLFLTSTKPTLVQYFLKLISKN